MHGGHFNWKKSLNFRQFVSLASCVRSYMLAQKCRPRIYEFWPKFVLMFYLVKKEIIVAIKHSENKMFAYFENEDGLE